MRILEIDQNNNIIVSPEVRLIPCFRKLFSRDKNKGYTQAIRECAFIYWYTDYRSDAVIFDDPQRTEEAKMLAGLKEEWYIDDLVQRAIDFYNEKQDSDAVRMLIAARVATRKLEEHFKNVDLTEINDKGVLINKATDLVSNLKAMGAVIAGLKELEEQVKKETAADSRIRGGGRKGMFEED